jgi:alpha-maltose-1-phosphate synthase
LVELLRAFVGVDCREAHLVFVGSGNQGSRLSIAAAALGVSERVHVVPFVSYGEMPNVFLTADLVVAPSLPTPYWEEQFGMVLVEAMASGRALVSTASGAIPEVVGDGAVVVPPYDVEALTDAMDRLLGDTEERMALGLRAREWACRRYAIGQVAPQIAECYRRVLAE